MKEELSKWKPGIGYLVIGVFAYLYIQIYEIIWEKTDWEELSSTTIIVIGAAIGASIAYTIAIYSKNQQRKLEEFLKKLEKTKIQESQLTPVKTTEPKFDWGKYVGYLTIPTIIAFSSGLSMSYSNQPLVILSIFLSSIAIGLAIAIFGIQQSQGGKLQGIVDEVYRFTGEGDRLLKEKREIYANSIVEYSLVFKEKFNKAFEIKESITDMKKDKKEAKNTTKTIQLMYQDIAQNRRPTFTTMEMLDVFGKNVAGFWNDFLKNASFGERFSTKDEELDEKLQFGFFMNCNTILQIIIKDILIYTSENVKKKKK